MKLQDNCTGSLSLGQDGEGRAVQGAEMVKGLFVRHILVNECSSDKRIYREKLKMFT